MQIAMRHARNHQTKCADLCEYLNRSISRRFYFPQIFFLIRDLCSIYIFHSRLSSAAAPRFNAEKKNSLRIPLHSSVYVLFLFRLFVSTNFRSQHRHAMDISTAAATKTAADESERE